MSIHWFCSLWKQATRSMYTAQHWLDVLYIVCFSNDKCVSVGTNLALNKPTWQVSTLTNNFRSSLGVDGFFDQNALNYRCIHTMIYTMPTTLWWAVDLGSTFNVQSIILYNRADCCCKWTNYDSLIMIAQWHLNAALHTCSEAVERFLIQNVGHFDPLHSSVNPSSVSIKYNCVP